MDDARLRTLTFSVVFSALGPLVLIGAVLMNTSTTQIADFLRRTAELSVLALALWTYKRLKKRTAGKERTARLEKNMYLASGGVLILGALFLVVVLAIDLVNPTVPEGNVIIGLSVASLGILFNGYFFIRYTLFHRSRPSAVMHTQGKIYQAKTFVDVNVVIALAAVLVFPGRMASFYVDVVGTGVIIVYMLIRGGLLLLEAKSQK